MAPPASPVDESAIRTACEQSHAGTNRNRARVPRLATGGLLDLVVGHTGQGSAVTVYGLLDRGDRVELLAMWPSDAGWVSQSAQHAQVLAQSTAHDAYAQLEPVAAALEGVSRALWQRFAQIDNSSFWDWLRRMTDVLLRHPPEQMPQMPDPDLEWIARLGRALEAVGDPELTLVAHAEVAAELAAIDAALLGDLQGRAAQARFMERPRADPRQVEAAFQVLTRQAVLGASLQGLTRVEPASAAVALARWLAGCAQLWADASGSTAAEAVDEAPLLHAAMRPVVQRVVAGVAGSPAAVDDALDDEFRAIGPMAVLRTLSDAYFAVRQTLVLMSEARADGSLCLGGRVCVRGGAPGDSADLLIGREIAARLDAGVS